MRHRGRVGVYIVKELERAPHWGLTLWVIIDEYMMQCRRIEKIHNGKFSTAKKKLCNAIWSPGKKYYFKKYNQFLK